MALLKVKSDQWKELDTKIQLQHGAGRKNSSTHQLCKFMPRKKTHQ